MLPVRSVGAPELIDATLSSGSIGNSKEFKSLKGRAVSPSGCPREVRRTPLICFSERDLVPVAGRFITSLLRFVPIRFYLPQRLA